eukprot:g59325.t1
MWLRRVWVCFLKIMGLFAFRAPSETQDTVPVSFARTVFLTHGATLLWINWSLSVGAALSRFLTPTPSSSSYLRLTCGLMIVFLRIHQMCILAKSFAKLCSFLRVHDSYTNFRSK